MVYVGNRCFMDLVSDFLGCSEVTVSSAYCATEVDIHVY